MKNLKIFFLIFLIILSLLFFSCKKENSEENTQQEETVKPLKPFPQHTKYSENIIKPNHKNQSELDSDVKNFYTAWKKRYLREEQNEKGPNGEKTYKIIVNSSGRVVSEAQGYGMIIISLMAGFDKDAKEIFDGLWYFSRNHKSNIDSRLMAWEVPEPTGGTDSAFDGDCDIAYALLLAHRQWGSSGKINYLDEAKNVIEAIEESTIGEDSYLPLLGDWVEQNGENYNQYTPRTSDFMLSNFRAFLKATNKSVWEKVIKNIQNAVETIQKNFSPDTGLLPDFLEGNGSIESLMPAHANFLEGPHDGDYYYNAGRDPWRIGLDVILTNNPTSRKEIKKIVDWLYNNTGGNPRNIKAGYHLNGEPVEGSSYFSTFFIAPFGVALMTDPSKQEFLNNLYDSLIGRYQGYYEDTVTLICLIIMSGNYWTF